MDSLFILLFYCVYVSWLTFWPASSISSTSPHFTSGNHQSVLFLLIYLFFYISLSSDFFFLITEFIALSICYVLITGLISWDTSGNQIEKNASPVEEITGGFREQKWQAIISNTYVD